MSVRKARRRGRDVWIVRVVNKATGRDVTRTCARQDEAKRVEAELRKRLQREALETGAGAPCFGGKIPTVETFSAAFLRHQKAVNRPSDYRRKSSIFAVHLNPDLGHLRLDQVTSKIVDSYKARKLETMKPGTVANIVITIKRMLSIAVDWGTIEAAPKIRQVRLQQTEFDYLREDSDLDEVALFLKAAGEWRTMFLVGIRTGLRLGELRALQWGDVDLDRGRIRVARTYSDKDGWGVPKSGKGRTIDLAWDVREALRELRGAARRADLVFPGEDGQPILERIVYQACVETGETADLGRRINPHKLRHTFASLAAQRGVPLPVLQAWMGHADIKTTMRYSHLAPSSGAQWVDRVAPPRPLRVLEGGEELRHPRGGASGGTCPPEPSKTADIDG